MIPFFQVPKFGIFCDNFDTCFMKFAIFYRNWGKNGFFSLEYGKMEFCHCHISNFYGVLYHMGKFHAFFFQYCKIRFRRVMPYQWAL